MNKCLHTVASVGFFIHIPFSSFGAGLVIYVQILRTVLAKYNFSMLCTCPAQFFAFGLLPDI